MGWPISSHSLLDDIEEEMRPHLALWAAATESQQDIPAWLDGPLEALDAHDVDSKVGAWIRDVSQQLLIFRERGDSAAASACEKTLAALRDFSQHLPVLMCVRAAGMRERHWAMIYERTGIEIRFDDPSLTLSAVLTAGLGEHLAVLEEVGHLAAQEHALEKALERMHAEWRHVEMPLEYRADLGTYVLGVVDDVYALLDEHMPRGLGLNRPHLNIALA